MSAIHKIIVGLAIAMIFPLCALGQPTLIPYESDPTNDLTPTLKWSNISYSSNYRLQIDDEPTFTSPMIITGQNLGNVTTYTTSILQEGSIYWRIASDVDGYVYSEYSHFVIDTTPPSLTINTVPNPTNQPSQTISGSMESGAKITISGSVTVGQITNSDATKWSCTISNFSAGNNVIEVTATDLAGNTTTKTATIEYLPDAITLTINDVPSTTNVGSQVISGTKGTDVTITSVVVDTGASANYSYPTDTSWECTITGLVEGDNLITVSGQNTSLGTATRTAIINYDITPPSFTIIVVSPTPQNSQTISGIKDAGTDISVDIDTAATVGDVASPNATSWSCIITGLESGTNTITVTATDAASNTAQQSTTIEYQPSGLTVDIDPVTNPTGETSQIISGTTDAAATVTVSADTGASVGPMTRNEANWSCTISGLAVGPNIITVVATLGAQTATRTTTITYDDTPPTFTIDAVVSPTNADSQTIRGTMEVGSTISVSVDTAANAGTPILHTSTWECTITGLVTGWNNITVTATDALNNSSSGGISIEYDATAPTVSINAVDTPTNNPGQQISGIREPGRPVSIIAIGATVSGMTYPSDDTWACTITVNNVGLDTTIVITVTVTDGASNSAMATASIVYDQTLPSLSINPVVSPTNQNYQVITGSMEAGAVVNVSVQNASAGSVVTNGTTWSCPVSGIVTEGSHTVNVNAVDAAGNTAFAGATIVYDRTPPSISVNGLPQYTNLNYVTLQGTREIGSTVTVTADTAATIGIVSYPSGTTWRCQVGNLEERLNVMTPTARDAAGNSMSASVSTTYDGTPPFLAINAVTTPTNVNSQQICGTREANLAVIVTTNTTASAGFVTYPSSTTWCCTISNLTEANNTMTASSTDLANNTTSAQTVIRYDATPPFVSIYQVTSPTNVNTQNIQGAMEVGAQIAVTVDTGAAVQNLVVGDNTWTCTVFGLSEMNNVITVTATDAAGNTSAQAATIRYDNTPPAVTVNAVTSPTLMITQTLSGTMETSAKVTLASDTAATFGNVTYPTTTSWACNVQSLQVGVNTITVTASDAASNAGTAITAITYYEVWPGDVNNDLNVDLADAILALQVCVAIPVSGVDKRADIDGDGKIDIREAVHALQSDAGLR